MNIRNRLAVVLLLSAGAVYAEHAEITVSPTSGANRVQLDWQAVPGRTYSIQTTPTLLPAAWTSATPDGVTVSNVLGAFESVSTNRTQFFRVAEVAGDRLSVIGNRFIPHLLVQPTRVISA